MTTPDDRRAFDGDAVPPGGASASGDAPRSGDGATPGVSPDVPGTDDTRTHDASEMDQQISSSHDISSPAGPLNGETADEEALRALMRDAVSDLQGSPDALEYLRRAVPQRRQRRRQAMVGAAATLVLAVVAIPALVHAAGSGSDPATTAAGVRPTATDGLGEDGHAQLPGRPTWQTSAGPDSSPGKPHPSTGSGGPALPPTTPTTTGAPVPDCTGDQLGQGASSADSPDGDGTVYGWFRLSNVSDTPCTVPSGGLVQALAQGDADPSRIQVVTHTAGDAAAALPTTAGPVVLKPGEDYKVDFAWVPSGDGPGGCTVPTTPPTTPTPSDTPTAGGGTDAGTGTTAGGGTGTGADTGSANSADAAGAADTPPDSGSDPTTPASGSIALNHTPAAGAPVVAGPVIQNVCAGTVYTAAPIADAGAAPAS
jgi:hypothetical protein